MTAKVSIGDDDVLLVVDVQNDFCPGGALAVPGGDEVVPIVNSLAGGSVRANGLEVRWDDP